MIVALDNTFLTLWISPDAKSRPDPKTGKPVDFCKERIEALIDSLSRNDRSRVIIPTPSLAEALVSAEDAIKITKELELYASVQIVPFDVRSAVELSYLTRAALAANNKKGGLDIDWQHVKHDRQIVAIAKAHGASILYTDDSSQTHFACQAGLSVKHTWDLELPAAYAQHSMSF